MKKHLFLLLAASATSQIWSEDLVWSPPDIISESTITPSVPPEPRLAIDGSGNAYAIWSELGTIKFKTKPAGGSWSSSTTLATLSKNPRLYADPSGNVTAIWITGTNLRTASKPSGMSFGAPTTLSTAAAAADLEGDSNGNAVVLWTSSTGVQSNTKLFNGSWSGTADTLSTTASDTPMISIGDNGTVVATWHSVVSSINRISASTKTIGGSWSAETAISSPARNSVNQHVEVDANGNAAAIWYTYDKTGSTYYNVVATAAYCPNGGSWSLPVAISDKGYYNPTNPVRLRARVAFDNAGNAVAIWANSYDGAHFNIESSMRKAGGPGSWSIPITLVENNLYAFFDDIVSPNARDIFGSYHESDGSFAQVMSLIANTDTLQGLKWSIPEQISMERSGFSRNAAYISSNSIYAGSIWLNTDGTNVFVAAATASGTLLQPPSNLAVVQDSANYDIYVEYVNTLSWSPTPSPDVSLYHIYRNGVYLLSLDSSFTSYVDRNQDPNQTVVYEIASEDNKGTQSFKASVSFP